MTLQQVEDFREEAKELGSLLAAIADDDWARETTFKRWTINDVIQHLHYGDILGLKSATDVQTYISLRDELRAARDSGTTFQQFTREKLAHLTGRKLLAAWQRGYTDLADALGAMDESARLTWSGPDMGVRMFATARQMEVWAHGQEIHDVLGRNRSPKDRIKNIAVIGVKTYGWTFANRGLEPPGEPPHVRLTAPSGEIWEWNEPSQTDTVEGSAVEFCQVVTQVRNIADTQLTTSGEAARRWMEIAQCFAGPPETPPAPGTRAPADMNQRSP